MKKIVVVAAGMPFMYRDTQVDFDRISQFLQKNWESEELRLEMFIAEKNYYGACDRPEVRAQFIFDALLDPEVGIIFDGGGNNSDQVILYLTRFLDGLGPDQIAQIRQKNIRLCATSDGEQLLNFLGIRGLVSAVQAPPLGQIARPENAKTAEAMRQFLFERKIDDDVALQCFNPAAQGLKTLEGRLVMYNGHTRRAPYSPIIDDGEYGSILLLEATQEASRKDVVAGLRFVLDAMAKEGKKPRAIILSQSDILHDPAIVAELKKVAEKSSIPIFSGAPFGHNRKIISTPLPLQTDVKLTISESGVSMQISPCRILEEIDLSSKILQERAQKPYHVKPAPIQSGAIKFQEPLLVEKVYEANKSDLPPQQTTWVSRVKTDRAIRQEFLFAPAVRICQRLEATDLDCVDLKDRDVMIGFNGVPTFEEFRKRDSSATQQKYEEESLYNAAQDAQTVLLELLKTGQLQKANSLTFLVDGEAPKGFGDYLKDFAQGHDLQTTFYVGKAPQNEVLFPEGPPQAKGLVSCVEARLQIVQREQCR